MIFHKIKKRNIVWKLHKAGLVNQLMSLELACGIAFMEKSQLVVTNFTGFRYGSIFTASRINEQKQKIIANDKPNLFNLINMPNDLDYKLENDFVPTMAKEFDNTIQYYYKCSDGKNENYFAENRPRLILDPLKHAHFISNNLGFYSRYFFSRTKELDRMFSQIKFKEQYVNLSNLISEQLGKFSGIHIRLTDHTHFYGGTAQKRREAIEKLKNYELPIVVSTDDPDTIKNELGSEVILLDDIICKFFADHFVNLPFHDETVFGLICLLTLSNAQNFIGTPASTFSSLIHRIRMFKGFLNIFQDLSHEKNKKNSSETCPFSWNSLDMHTNVKNWYREWPEAKLSC